MMLVHITISVDDVSTYTKNELDKISLQAAGIAFKAGRLSLKLGCVDFCVLRHNLSVLKENLGRMTSLFQNVLFSVSILSYYLIFQGLVLIYIYIKENLQNVLFCVSIFSHFLIFRRLVLGKLIYIYIKENLGRMT